MAAFEFAVSAEGGYVIVDYAFGMVLIMVGGRVVVGVVLDVLGVMSCCVMFVVRGMLGGNGSGRNEACEGQD